ncbi:hypothetical protein [Providencia alcalifaciens]|uniref:hypothetical protein n=1 Tax=Providencia alcalifaciens TaxID=126385 RepID=UPI002B053116|nr:hypothetical protein [Providencia alcalifaciens]
MSIEINCNSDYVEYMYENNEDNSFLTGDLSLVASNVSQEKSAGYKEPDDTVMTQIYMAESDHGEFRWEVTARREGFNSFAEIEDVRLIEAPENCETLDLPSFEIKESE